MKILSACECNLQRRRYATLRLIVSLATAHKNHRNCLTVAISFGSLSLSEFIRFGRLKRIYIPLIYFLPQRLEGNNESPVLVDVFGCVAAVGHRNFPASPPPPPPPSFS